ncbi:MAG: shikimate kinase [Defluviitaleaceae bacterium]|nr:shikimate kinase [Defluviitaleaceae bacterium]
MAKFGLLGQKLAHSYSPAIHAAFGGYDYALFEVEPQNLSDFMKSSTFTGINVTIPYKQAVLPFCAEISPVAQEIGSVNTIIRRTDGSLYGHNTDATGFKRVACAAIGNPYTKPHTRLDSTNRVTGKKVIILGNGGSSLSVIHVMRELGASEIIVVGRKDNNESFLRQHSDTAILVSCTPVGMYPNVNEAPCSLANFPNLECVMDIIYNPTRTRLMMDAEARGIPNIGGLMMLIGQAAESSEMFTGRWVSEVVEKNAINKIRRQMENIILIGMPGSGKTTHGKLLAEELNKPFIDTDDEIQKAANRTIPEIFAQEGEVGFRKLETEALAKIGKESGLVIATGGGCVTREENYPHLHQNGIIIFTERDTQNLAREGRPLSQGDLSALYEKRLPMYRRFADISINANGEPQPVVQKILEALNEAYSN